MFHPTNRKLISPQLKTPQKVLTYIHTYIHAYIHTCIHQVPFLATYLHIEFFSAAGKSVSFWRPVDKSNALTEHLADLDAIHFYSAVNFGQSTLILAYIFLF